jgi:ABC-2 type transport system permease protein
MTGWFAIFRHEWRQFWATPLAGVFLIIYCLMSMLLTFFIGDLLPKGRAELSGFFQFQPWLLMALAPALSMRSWSDTLHNGSAEALLTLPITTTQVVLGKYLAQLLLIVLAMCGCFTLWTTVTLLGIPDHGLIFSSFIACIILAVLLLAVGNAISASMRTASGAFALSLLAGAVLLVLGAPFMQNIFGLPLHLFSLLSLTQPIFDGLLRLSDILLLLLISGTALALTIFQVNRKRNVAFRNWTKVGLIFVTLFMLVSFLPNRLALDATDRKSFTLTKESRTLVANMRAPIQIEYVKYTSRARSYPLLEKRALRTENFLDQYGRSGAGNIVVKHTKAESKDLEPVSVAQGEEVSLGLVIKNTNGRKIALSLLEVRDDSRIEYEITRALQKLSHDKPPLLAILSTLPLPTGRGGALAAMRGESEPMQILTELQAQYDIRLLTPEQLNLQGISALLMLQPPPLRPDNIDAIDGYVKAGGRILATADPWPELWQDQPGSLTSSAGLAPLLVRWGIALKPDAIIIDSMNAQKVDTTSLSGEPDRAAYPMWLDFNGLRLLSSGAWDANPKTSLLRGSTAAHYISIAEAMTAPAPEQLSNAMNSISSPLLAFATDQGIFIADSDMLDDAIWDENAQNGNFLLYCVDILTNQTGLIPLRQRLGNSRDFSHLVGLPYAARARAHSWIILLNLTAVPIAIGLLTFLHLLRRHRRAKA